MNTEPKTITSNNDNAYGTNASNVSTLGSWMNWLTGGSSQTEVAQGEGEKRASLAEQPDSSGTVQPSQEPIMHRIARGNSVRGNGNTPFGRINAAELKQHRASMSMTRQQGQVLLQKMKEMSVAESSTEQKNDTASSVANETPNESQKSQEPQVEKNSSPVLSIEEREARLMKRPMPVPPKRSRTLSQLPLVKQVPEDSSLQSEINENSKAEKNLEKNENATE